MGIEELLSKEDFREVLGDAPEPMKIGIVINGQQLELNEQERELLCILLNSTEMDNSRATLSKLKTELGKEFVIPF